MVAKLSGFADGISELLLGINAVTNPLSTFVDRVTFMDTSNKVDSAARTEIVRGLL